LGAISEHLAWPWTVEDPPELFHRIGAVALKLFFARAHLAPKVR